jgi:hypothetical protein
MNTREKTQNDYIKKQLRDFSACKLKISLPDASMTKISTPIVKNILTNEYTNGQDMDAIVCLFDTLFLSSIEKGNTLTKRDGIYHLGVHISKWLKKLDKIGSDSVAGYVYVADILEGINVVIKVSKDIRTYNDMIREYYIGVSEINKLRYILPNFVYTFASFICPSMVDSKDSSAMCQGDSHLTPYIIFEEIKGANMEVMLKNDALTFPEYLGMFIQILLALETAQRYIGFCHFDLHAANLMCRTLPKGKKCRYSVPIDNFIYDVTSINYLPVIIDFGLSTVRHNSTDDTQSKWIGSYDFPQHGMMNYLISGVDMYKFLLYSAYSAKSIQRQILDLFSFYGKDDPYKLYMQEDAKKILSRATDKYGKQMSFSKVAQNTPLEFLSWILVKYPSIVNVYISKKERQVYVPLTFSTISTSYCDMLNKDKKGKDVAVSIIDHVSSIDNSSYITVSYCLYVLDGYNKRLKSAKIARDIEKLLKRVEKNRSEMIESDKKMLIEYTQIKTDTYTPIIKLCKKILSITMASKNKNKIKKNELIKLINNFTYLYAQINDVCKYMNLLYTIRELGLDTIYSDFVSKFTKSSIYKFYVINVSMIEKTARWVDSLSGYNETH